MFFSKFAQMSSTKRCIEYICLGANISMYSGDIFEGKEICLARFASVANVRVLLSQTILFTVWSLEIYLD